MRLGIGKKSENRKKSLRSSRICVLVMFVTNRAPQDLTDRYALLMNEECRRHAVAGTKRGIAALLLILILVRLLRVGVRLAALVARVRNAALPVARRCAASRRRTGSPRVPRDLPERFAWLLQMAPVTGGNNEALYRLLSRPEMVALVARAPKIRRVWRPLRRAPAVKMFLTFWVVSILLPA
jgi:hypothetical protein